MSSTSLSTSHTSTMFHPCSLSDLTRQGHIYRSIGYVCLLCIGIRNLCTYYLFDLLMLCEWKRYFISQRHRRRRERAGGGNKAIPRLRPSKQSAPRRFHNAAAATQKKEIMFQRQEETYMMIVHAFNLSGHIY